MPQVVIRLSAPDYRPLTEVGRTVKRRLNPLLCQRPSWQGRSSFPRQLIPCGFEEASEPPGKFLPQVRETRDRMIGRRRRSEAGTKRCEATAGVWRELFPPFRPAGRPHKSRTTDCVDLTTVPWRA